MMSLKDTLGVIYFAFFLTCMILTYWIEWAFLVFIGVSCVMGLIMMLYSDYKKDKRIDYLESQIQQNMSEKKE